MQSCGVDIQWGLVRFYFVIEPVTTVRFGPERLARSALLHGNADVTCRLSLVMYSSYNAIHWPLVHADMPLWNAKHRYCSAANKGVAGNVHCGLIHACLSFRHIFSDDRRFCTFLFSYQAEIFFRSAAFLIDGDYVFKLTGIYSRKIPHYYICECCKPSALLIQG